MKYSMELTAEPVSYTHLDVYKRQTLASTMVIKHTVLMVAR